MFLSKSAHPVKKIIVSLWIVLAIGGIIFSSWYFSAHSVEEAFSSLANIGVSPYSVGILLGIYLLRTLIFIPLSIVLIATPLILGDFWAAVLVAGIGEILSASFQFWLARIYGRTFIEESDSKTLKIINEKISKFGGVSIALLRLLPVPFDLINLGAGMTRMKFSDYFWVTLVSVWPDCLSYVAVGQAANNPLSLLFTGGITLIVFLIIWYLKDHPEYRKMLILEIQEKTKSMRNKLKAWKGKRKKRF